MEHKVEDGVIEVSFMTAWGPSDMAFDTYLGKNDDVTIENYFMSPVMHLQVLIQNQLKY